MLSVKELVIVSKGILLNGDEKYIPTDYVIDSRNINNKAFFVPIKGERVDGQNYIIDAVNCGICGYFITRDCKNKKYIIDETIKINKDIIIIEVDDAKEALYNSGKYNRIKHIDIPVVAVTGSVGKTSTREMIASVLATEKKVLVTNANYNSLIGAPLMALKIDNQDICVLEIGTDCKGEIEKLSELLVPDIGVITMIGTAHIGNFGSRENIYKEKIQICSHMKEKSTLIVNGDDDFLVKLHSNELINVEKFKKKDISNLEENINGIKFNTNIYGKDEEIIINQIGIHNVQNAICAIRVAEKFNIKKENIINGIKKYKNFSRRLEKIELENNIVLIDDTYNASIDSMKSGLKTVNKINSKRKIAVLGDMLELGEFSDKIHSDVGKIFGNLKYDILYVIGSKSKLIAKEAKKFLYVKEFNDIDKLIFDLKNEIKSGDLIYLKASNGMKFNKIVNSLKAK